MTAELSTPGLVVPESDATAAYRARIDALADRIDAAAREDDKISTNDLYWALIKVMERTCGATPLMVLDAGETAEFLATFDDSDVDEEDAEDLTAALKAMRPVLRKMDDVTWCTQLLRLRQNPQPLSWWGKHMNADFASNLPDNAWDAHKEAMKDLLEEAVQYMIDHPEDFTTAPENPDEQP